MLVTKICTVEEEFFNSHEIFVDGGTIKENIGKLEFPQIGVYATPYDMAFPLLKIQSSRIVDAMPENLLKQVAAWSQHAGAPQELREKLRKELAAHKLHVAVVFWKGLVAQPPVYNAVFHPLVGAWLHKSATESFNVPVQAGILSAHGVQAGPDASIAFNGVADLEVNRHDLDNYSPNNGKFAVEPGRGVATFWLAGAYNGNVTVSYNVLLVQPQLQQQVQGIVDHLAAQKTSAQDIAYVQGRLERFIKTLDGEDKHADSAALYDALEVIRKLAK